MQSWLALAIILTSVAGCASHPSDVGPERSIRLAASDAPEGYHLLPIPDVCVYCQDGEWYPKTNPTDVPADAAARTKSIVETTGLPDTAWVILFQESSGSGSVKVWVLSYASIPRIEHSLGFCGEGQARFGFISGHEVVVVDGEGISDSRSERDVTAVTFAFYEELRAEYSGATYCTPRELALAQELATVGPNAFGEPNDDFSHAASVTADDRFRVSNGQALNVGDEDWYRYRILGGNVSIYQYGTLNLTIDLYDNAGKAIAHAPSTPMHGYQTVRENLLCLSLAEGDYVLRVASLQTTRSSEPGSEMYQLSVHDGTNPYDRENPCKSP